MNDARARFIEPALRGPHLLKMSRSMPSTFTLVEQPLGPSSWMEPKTSVCSSCAQKILEHGRANWASCVSWRWPSRRHPAQLVYHVETLSSYFPIGRKCGRGEGVQGVLTLFCSGATQVVCHALRVEELREQLEVEEEDGDRQEEEVEVESGEVESRRVRHG